jgi:putative intracellular protease/amidase
LFPGIQQLDLTGPYDVLGSLPDVKLHLVWKDLAPVTSSTGLVFTPTMTYADCPNLDVICVPGGSGVGALMEDPQTLDFLKAQAQTARYVTSVCTGSLVLGAAGLLRGRKATTHWAYHDMLAPLGAIPVAALPQVSTLRWCWRRSYTAKRRRNWCSCRLNTRRRRRSIRVARTQRLRMCWRKPKSAPPSRARRGVR